jgi:hypothetical protein
MAGGNLDTVNYHILDSPILALTLYPCSTQQLNNLKKLIKSQNIINIIINNQTIELTINDQPAIIQYSLNIIQLLINERSTKIL